MTKAEHVYAVVRERILQGVYRPGQRLVPAALRSELGASTIPIREAFRRLEAEGWLIYRANIGAEVRSVDVTEWVTYMDALTPLEAHATALGASALGEEELLRAREANERMRECMQRSDPVTAHDWNLLFHKILVDACPNAYVRKLIAEISERLEAIRRVVLVLAPGRTWAAFDEHEHLLSLIEAHADPDEIERYAREHKRRTIVEYLGNGGLDPESSTDTDVVRAALAARRAPTAVTS